MPTPGAVQRRIAKRSGKPPLGSGQRFKQLQGKLKKKGVKDTGALAAYIGRKKYGKKRFAALSVKGR
jgi:hypothetical protein